jgi:hypothetical protein
MPIEPGKRAENLEGDVEPVGKEHAAIALLDIRSNDVFRFANVDR